MKQTFIIRLAFLLAIPLFHSCQVKKCSTNKNKMNSQSAQKENILLNGAWGNNSIGNADFSFYQDTIYYPDTNTFYRYKVVKDTISIYEEDNKIRKILILKNTIDSLILNYIDVNVIMRYGKRNSDEHF